MYFSPQRLHRRMNTWDKTKNFQQICLTATWGDVLSGAADFHPVAGCLKGLTVSGSAGHYQACHIEKQ